MNTPIPCRNCGTLHVMTEGSVISRCLACPVKGRIPPLIVKHSESLADVVFEPGKVVTLKMNDQLSELEEWIDAHMELNEKRLMSPSMYGPEITDYTKSQQSTFAMILAKIAEMREVDT